jgi:hypothetical protein
MGTYDTHTGFFENRSKLEDLPVQSPIPLGRSFRYFVVTQQEVSPTDGKGASVGLATCSVSELTSKKTIYLVFVAFKTNTNMYINERLLYMVC